MQTIVIMKYVCGKQLLSSSFAGHPPSSHRPSCPFPNQILFSPLPSPFPTPPPPLPAPLRPLSTAATSFLPPRRLRLLLTTCPPPPQPPPTGPVLRIALTERWSRVDRLPLAISRQLPGWHFTGE
ncbi:uncharacterized 16 kDa protein in middle repetitive insertion sequence WIS1-like [Rhododendron vialii]|uniref:uncharacterized 16 kDa protein in middle repetitive insertion sequence WIS1-like n=1 Tax=Rhododendron vialii TaxID=182163 RepID=UPI00265E0492|nr:uncharacterized 16 kDa protein in middle repetitive insertion sequence WIS1-like [Rhododendron vialii]